jgi:NADH-quinone oxidoreductase subunit K
MVPSVYYLILAGILFTIGALGVLVRRNAIVVFMSLEMMFNAVNLVFVTFAAYYNVLFGQLLVFFVMAVAAAEVAVGLALIVMVYRAKDSVNVDQMDTMKG